MRILHSSCLRRRALAQDGATRADWNYHGGTQFAWRYSALDQINRSNVKNLAPVWAFQTGDYEMGLQSTPIVVDGVMYLSTSRSQVFALDAATGRLIWQYKYPLPRVTVLTGRRTAASRWATAKCLSAPTTTIWSRIDQKTGQEAWRVSLDDIAPMRLHITAAPLVVKDKVIVGGAGGDSAHRGYLTAVYRSRPDAWRGASTPFPGQAKKATKPGRAIAGSSAAGRPG